MASEETSSSLNEDEVCFEPGLFIDEEYTITNYTFDEVVQPLLCSQAASTDFDLTGQIVWPISIYVAWFVVRMRKLFEGKTVVELGAGCGLSGLVASQFSKTTVLTDGSDVIMRLLQRNIHIQVEENGLAPGKVEARKLVWGEREEVETCTLEFGYPDVLLGADVVCWPQFVGPFLQTVSALIRGSASEEAAMYLGYVCRATSTTDLFYRKAEELGFSVEVVDAGDFIPEFRTDARPENTKTTYDLQLLKLSLDKLSDGAMVEEARWRHSTATEHVEGLQQAAPC